MFTGFFAAVMTAGVVFLLFSIFFGEVADIDADVDVDIDVDGGLDLDVGDGTEARGLGCTVIAAGMAGFGSVGLMGSLAGWTLLYTVIVAVAFGLLFGRSTMAILNWVVRQQSNDLMTTQSLIGLEARITVDTPPGQIGEAMVQADSIIKYPVRALDETVMLHKGDVVRVYDVVNGRLVVSKLD